MSRFYLRFALIPITLFAAALLFIHAQRYDDHELRELLLPEGCPAPCFMGIKPGVTKFDEAIKLLQTHKWVEHVEDGMFQISWSWNNQAPSWISKAERGEIFAPAKVVQTMTIYTEIPLGSTRLMLGVPDMEVVDAMRDRGSQYALYFASYHQNGLSFQNWQPCKGTEPFRIPVRLGLSESTNTPPRYVNSLSDIFRAC